MTHNPSPESPPAQLPQKVHQLDSRELSRYLRVEQHLSAVDFSRVPFEGYHKFNQNSFRYAQEHVSLPTVLYFRGETPEVLNAPLVVSFCGTETPTIRGFQLTELLAQIASQRGLVISGGVHGIDMAAHLGALDGGGPTVAVVANSPGSGIHPYVPQRTFIENGILASGGGILSEYPDDVPDRRERLLARDRIIAGLCDILVVIEASENSASVDTAKRAYLQGKMVCMVDWSRFTTPSDETPKISGARQLKELGIARGFPSGAVTDFADPKLANEFGALLSTVARETAR
jgi:hypothetical protein